MSWKRRVFSFSLFFFLFLSFSFFFNSSTFEYLHLGYQEQACLEGMFTTASSFNLFCASLQEEKAPEVSQSWEGSQATLSESFSEPRLCTSLGLFTSLGFFQVIPYNFGKINQLPVGLFAEMRVPAGIGRVKGYGDTAEGPGWCFSS